jgi:hypothetical protein
MLGRDALGRVMADASSDSGAPDSIAHPWVNADATVIATGAIELRTEGGIEFRTDGGIRLARDDGGALARFDGGGIVTRLGRSSMTLKRPGRGRLEGGGRTRPAVPVERGAKAAILSRCRTTRTPPPSSARPATRTGTTPPPSR